LDKNTSLDGRNIDDKIQSSGENEDSNYEDEYMIKSSGESEVESFNNNEVDD
jgi:hypothetical protein